MKYNVIEEKEGTKKVLYSSETYEDAQVALREAVGKYYKEYWFEGELENFNRKYYSELTKDNVLNVLLHLRIIYNSGLRCGEKLDLYDLISDLEFVHILSKTPGQGGIFYGTECLVDAETFYKDDFNIFSFTGHKLYIEKSE